MPVSAIAAQACSVARTVALIGDPWSLLLLRELFLGSRRFDEFQRHTGAAPHLLSLRLRRLQAAGIVEARPYQQHPPRREYHLTDKGVALWPVMSALRQWGDRWQHDGGPLPVRVLHQGCGGVLRLEQRCSRCGEAVNPRQVDLRLSRRADTERASQRVRTPAGKPSAGAT